MANNIQVPRDFLSFRASRKHLKQLDELCATNGRSRRDIVELLIARAHAEFKADKNVRINP